MKVTIVDVEVNSVTKGKNSYKIAEVVYASGDGQKKTQKIVDFANPSVFAVVSKAVKGNVFDVTVTKNDAGFNQWSSIAAEGEAPVGDAPRASAPAPAASSNRSTGAAPAAPVRSTYETAEERAVRQRLIVRQSSITAAVAILTHANKSAITSEEVLTLAEEVTNWVFEEKQFKLEAPPRDVSSPKNNFDDLDDDIPL